MENLRNRSASPWLARWGVVLFLGGVASAASCGNGDSSSGPPQRGGSSGQGGSANGGTAGENTLSGGASNNTNGGVASGGAVSGGAGASSAGENGAGTAGVAGLAGEGPVSNAGSAGTPLDGGRDYPDVVFTYDAAVDAELTPDAACASGSVQTEPIPLDLYVMLDRSGTMNLPQAMPSETEGGKGDCNVGDPLRSRWCFSINALSSFFVSEPAIGSGVALQFFPAGDCGGVSSNPFQPPACCNSGACCGGTAESKPEVLLANLPEAHSDLVTAMNAAVPSADTTPIEAAVRALTQYTASAARPGRQMMGLLITDGGPEGCLTTNVSLAALVRSQLQQLRIPTYIVGTTDAAYDWLEPIAEAGGAPAHTARCAGKISPCHYYNVGSGSPDVFIDVLQQIRRSAIACSFAMPHGDSGLVDPSEVALSMTLSAGGSPLRLHRLNTATDCAQADGFYYDNASSPTTILLCPSTCSALRAGDGGKVEILLGCQGS